jgi:hypothetical protein
VTAFAEAARALQTSHFGAVTAQIVSSAVRDGYAEAFQTTGLRDLLKVSQSLSLFSNSLRPINQYESLSPISVLASARNLQRTLQSNPSFKLPAARSATEALWSTDGENLEECIGELLSHEETRANVGDLTEILQTAMEGDQAPKTKRQKYRLSNADPGILTFSALVMLCSLAGDVVGAVKPNLAPIVDHHATTLGIAVAMILVIHDQLRGD